MSAGQRSGSGAMTELVDEKVRKNDILSKRDKAQRLPGQSLDGKGAQADEYKDNPSNRRPASDDGLEPDTKAVLSESMEASQKPDRPEPQRAGSRHRCEEEPKRMGVAEIGGHEPSSRRSLILGRRFCGCRSDTDIGVDLRCFEAPPLRQ